MGRPSSTPTGRPNQNPIIITHFSHPHLLCLITPTYPPTAATAGPQCSGCSLPAAASSPSYICSQCNFLLHHMCATLPPLLLHPCDPSHGLALLPRPPYPDLRYTCDACARPGAGFVYHCAACGLDLHVRCARAPTMVSCSAHAQHALALAFGAPYGEGKGFTCDACGRGGGSREWLYKCAACEFDVHLVCGGGIEATTVAAPVAYGGGYGEGRPTMAAAAVATGREFVQSVAQGIAVELVQGIMGGRGGGGGGGDGGEGSNGFVADMGGEIISGIFGGSEDESQPYN